MLARVIALTALIVTGSVSFGDETPPQLGDGRYAPSPDGKLYVFYNVPKLEIRKARTTAVVGSIEQALPVQALRWTGDSMTLVVIHHIAHGSNVTFLHWDGRSWRAQAVSEPFEHPGYRAIAVVGVRPAHDTVEVTYKTDIPTQLVSFTFAPITGNIRKLRRQDISSERWQQLRMFPLGMTNASTQASELTPSRRSPELSVISIPQSAATRAPARGGSSCSR